MEHTHTMMKKLRSSLFFLSTFTVALLLNARLYAQKTGNIKGRILQQATKHPIENATISVVNKGITVSADASGNFIMSNLPEGNYALVITSVGFQSKTLLDVPVVNGKTYYLETELYDDVRKLTEVTVKTRSFKGEHNPLAPVSSFSFSREEIFRSPGAQGDIFRAIGLLPGVVSSGSQYSAIAVRGQGTGENVYMVDDIPVYDLSHLEIEGFNAGFNDPNGGRFGVFAPRVIDNAQFQGGGFGAQYGRKSSSYLGLNIKEGNKETPFLSGQFDLLGFTLIYDGPSGVAKNTGLFASARYQNFKYLFKVIDQESNGLPIFGDVVVKTTTQLNKKNKLDFMFMMNPEEYTRTLDNVLQAKNLNDINSSNVIGASKTNKAVVGLNLRTLTSNNSYWKNVLYYRWKDVDNNVGYSFPNVLPDGTLLHTGFIQNESDLHHVKNTQSEYGYRSFITKRTKDITATVGFDLSETKFEFTNTLKHTDTLYTFYPLDLRPPNQYFLVVNPSQYNVAFSKWAYNASGYVDLSFKLFNRLTLNPGVRYDYTEFVRQGTWSPRISGSVAIDDKQSVNFATGIFYQDPSYQNLASPTGRYLKTERTEQYILGYKIYFSPDLKLTLEGWYKEFRDLTVQPSFGSPFVNNNGTGYASGADINLTKRLTKKVYGQVGYSYMKSRRDDHDGLGIYDYTFQVPHTASFLGSYKPNEKWVFSGKFRYSTGRPTNKYVVHSDVLNDVNHLRYSQEVVAKNADKLQDFISLDVRADYKLQRKRQSYTIFFDIVDILNRTNENSRIFQNLTGSTYPLGLGIFPTFGLRIDL